MGMMRGAWKSGSGVCGVNAFVTWVYSAVSIQIVYLQKAQPHPKTYPFPSLFSSPYN